MHPRIMCRLCPRTIGVLCWPVQDPRPDVYSLNATTANIRFGVICGRRPQRDGRFFLWLQDVPCPSVDRDDHLFYRRELCERCFDLLADMRHTT
jgi:hypothetical protein